MQNNSLPALRQHARLALFSGHSPDYLLRPDSAARHFSHDSKRKDSPSHGLVSLDPLQPKYERLSKVTVAEAVTLIQTAVRFVGGIITIVAEKKKDNIGLFIAALVLLNVGVVPLIIADLGLTRIMLVHRHLAQHPSLTVTTLVACRTTTAITQTRPKSLNCFVLPS